MTPKPDKTTKLEGSGTDDVGMGRPESKLPSGPTGNRVSTYVAERRVTVLPTSADP
jgi:hypothetical protein